MAKRNSTVAPMPLTFTAYNMAQGLVSLDDAGAEVHIGIGELVNRADLIARLSAEDALRIGSWHASFVERKNRRAHESPAKKYMVYDGKKSKTSIWGGLLFSEYNSPAPAIAACKDARASCPRACVVESTRFF